MGDRNGDARSAWCLELLGWWRFYNALYLDSALREPVVRLAPGSGSLGSWDRATRTLSIAEAHVRQHAWLAVMETLRHEMAHQYAHEVLGAAGETPHGPAFRRACHRLRVSPCAGGRGDEVTAQDPAGPRPARPLVERVHKLLSLSSSPNEHEAQVALNKARELLLKHNIDAVDLGADREFSVRWLGPVKGRHHHHEQILASILNDFFFVSVIWAHSYDAERRVPGTVLAAYGSPSNLEMAEYVHGYLTAVVESLWADYRDRRGLPGNRDRLRYAAGVLQGFRDKLEAQDRVLRRRRALVWKGDPELESYLRYHHPSIRSGYAGGGARTRAFADGVEEGRAVTLRRPIRGMSGGIAGYLRG